MREILILGRGGQGAQTAGTQLARAFFAEGQYVQTFATYGGARRGTPVTASLCVDERPIRRRANIDRASALLCFDDSLMDAAFLSFAGPRTVTVVNSTHPAEAFAGLGAGRVLAIDGHAIARRSGMGKVVNSALLGALAAAMGAPALATLQSVIGATAPAKVEENLEACNAAHRLMRNAISEPA